MRRILTALATLATLSPGPWAALAEDWPQWRGPSANGVSGETGLPLRWGAAQGVAWRAPIAGLGTSTPVVRSGHIYVTSQIGMGLLDRRGAEFAAAESARDYDTPDGTVEFLVIALRAADGEPAWVHRFPAEGAPDALPSVHPKHNLASPSVATDASRIYAWMGTGQVVALTHLGELVWERHIGRDYAPFDVLWGHGSSPYLYGDTLFLLCDHPAGAYLLALDSATGKERYRIERGEGVRSYSTPVVLEDDDGVPQLIVNGSHRIEAYAPATGEPLWHAGEEVTLAVGMPVASDGVLFASRGYSSGPYSAIRLGGRGDVNGTHVEWHVPTRAPYISSLLVSAGRIFMATERGVASVVDAETGELLWRERLEGAFTASPVAGDDKVYAVNESGVTFVLAASGAPRVLARNDLEERVLASPAISDRKLYFRTDAYVVAIAGDAEAVTRR